MIITRMMSSPLKQRDFVQLSSIPYILSTAFLLIYGGSGLCQTCRSSTLKYIADRNSHLNPKRFASTISNNRRNDKNSDSNSNNDHSDIFSKKNADKSIQSGGIIEIGPLPEYRRRVALGLVKHDEKQLRAVLRLQTLCEEFLNYKPPEIKVLPGEPLV